MKIKILLLLIIYSVLEKYSYAKILMNKLFQNISIEYQDKLLVAHDENGIYTK